MAKSILNELKGSVPFWVCLTTALLLIVASFIVPPTGVIDGSVLKAVGEIFGFATLWTVYRAVERGIDAQVTHGNTTVTVGDIVKSEENAE